MDETSRPAQTTPPFRPSPVLTPMVRSYGVTRVLSVMSSPDQVSRVDPVPREPESVTTRSVTFSPVQKSTRSVASRALPLRRSTVPTALSASPSPWSTTTSTTTSGHAPDTRTWVSGIPATSQISESKPRSVMTVRLGSVVTMSNAVIVPEHQPDPVSSGAPSRETVTGSTVSAASLVVPRVQLLPLRSLTSLTTASPALSPAERSRTWLPPSPTRVTAAATSSPYATGTSPGMLWATIRPSASSTNPPKPPSAASTEPLP